MRFVGALWIVLAAGCGSDNTDGDAAVAPDLAVAADLATPDLAKGEPIGGPCTTNGDCAMGVCVPFPGGYCSEPCANSACPSGATCVTSGQTSACLAACARATDCRPGYVCDPTYYVCVPAAPPPDMSIPADLSTAFDSSLPVDSSTPRDSSLATDMAKLGDLATPADLVACGAPKAGCTLNSYCCPGLPCDPTVHQCCIATNSLLTCNSSAQCCGTYGFCKLGTCCQSTFGPCINSGDCCNLNCDTNSHTCM
jgi:hypothetical protein